LNSNQQIADLALLYPSNAASATAITAPIRHHHLRLFSVEPPFHFQDKPNQILIGDNNNNNDSGVRSEKKE
jgi:hypothetical protein